MDLEPEYADLIVIDGHCDTVLEMAGINEPNNCTSPRSLLERGRTGHIDLPRLMEAGVSCQFFAMFTSDEYLPRAPEHCQYLLEMLRAACARSPALCLATTAADIRQAKARGQVAMLLAIEGGEAIGTSMERLRGFYEQGVRLMTLTWNHRNAIARGVGAEGDDGLSPFGRGVVREMEQMGMVVDVSHLADRSLLDVLDCATKPLVASHSNSRTLCPHPRNLSDSLAKAIASTGGLIGLTFAGSFVDHQPEKVTLARWLDHLDHLCGLVGTEHVGLGSDFDGFSDQNGLVMPDCLGLPALARAMAGRGYTADEVAAIMGGNWLRVLEILIG